MGHVVKPWKEDVLVRKDNFAVTDTEELIKLRSKRIDVINRRIEEIEKRTDEINVESKVSGLGQEQVNVLLEELLKLEDEKDKLKDEQNLLVKNPVGQTLGEHRTGLMIVIYSDGVFFDGFYSKHCARMWRDERLWARDPVAKEATVLVAWHTGMLLPPEVRPSTDMARAVIEASLQKAAMKELRSRVEQEYGIVVVPLEQPIRNWALYTRQYDFEKRKFVDDVYSMGGFKFQDVHLLRTSQDWKKFVEGKISQKEYGEIQAMIADGKQPGKKHVYGQVWMVIEYFPKRG